MLELRDRLGRPYKPMMDPALRRGKRPANYGKKYPVELLTAGEVGRLIAACPRRGVSGLRNRAIIVTNWRCGLRISELVGQRGLEVRDVDVEDLTITVREGKRRKRRVVGVDPMSMAVIVRWIDARSKLGIPRNLTALFCTISRDAGGPGRPLSQSYVREMIKERGEKAGIDKRVHPHGLRHTFAVDLLREGVDVKTISTLLGHSDLGTTDTYLRGLLPIEAVRAAQRREWPSGVAA